MIFILVGFLGQCSCILILRAGISFWKPCFCFLEKCYLLQYMMGFQKVHRKVKVNGKMKILCMDFFPHQNVSSFHFSMNFLKSLHSNCRNTKDDFKDWRNSKNVALWGSVSSVSCHSCASDKLCVYKRGREPGLRVLQAYNLSAAA